MAAPAAIRLPRRGAAGSAGLRAGWVGLSAGLPAAGLEYAADLGGALARALGHVRVAVAERQDPLRGAGVVAGGVAPPGLRRGGGPPGQTSRPLVLLVEGIQVLSPARREQPGLPSGGRQPVRPLGLEIRELKHRVSTLAGVAEDGVQPDPAA